MHIQEELQQHTNQHTQLAFIEAFLKDHPDAELFLVGGAVRDLLMRRKMTEMDFDFVIRGMDPKAIEDWFSTRGEINFVGKTFGVYKFMPEGLDPSRTPYVDIALPRTEAPQQNSKGGYKEFHVHSDATLPIEEDLARRDFTINAMALNIRTDELVDPYQGRGDVNKRLIRAVGDPQERFNEDLSRMLRAIRFASELAFDIEPQTLAAIRTNIKRIHDRRSDDAGDYVIARETLGSELAKALARAPQATYTWLKKTDALNALFDEVPVGCLDNVRQNEPTLCAGLLLQNHTPDHARERLHITGLDALPRGTPLRIEPEDVLWLIARLQETWNAQSIAQLRASQFEKYVMNGKGGLFVRALEATGQTQTHRAATERARAIRERWSVEDDEPIPALLSGNDLLAADIPAGPRIRETLERLRDAQLDGHILTREAAKTWLAQCGASGTMEPHS